MRSRQTRVEKRSERVKGSIFETSRPDLLYTSDSVVFYTWLCENIESKYKCPHMSEGERIKGDKRMKKGVGVERCGGEGQGRTAA